MTISIQKASPQDAEEILALQKLAYISEAEIYQDFNLPPLKQTLDEMRTDFEKQTIWKAESGGRIVGSVRGFIKDGTFYVGRLIVDPDHQNQGIGGRLMKTLENESTEAGRFELFTGDKSEKNIYLYEKLGYQVSRPCRSTND